MPTTCIANCLVCVYSENPADYPIGLFSFVNLVLANATNHIQTRCHQYEKTNLTNEKNSDFINNVEFYIV